MNRLFVLLFSLLLAACNSGPRERTVGLITDSAMVVSAHPLASEVGVAIIRNGGNAIDAAIATQLALAVVDEHSASIVQNKHVIVGVRIESSRSRQKSSGGWNLPRIKARHRELRLLIVTGAADDKT